MKANSLVGVGLIWGRVENDPGLLLIPPRPLDLVNPIKYIVPFSQRSFLCPRPYYILSLSLFFVILCSSSYKLQSSLATTRWTVCKGILGLSRGWTAHQSFDRNITTF